MAQSLNKQLLIGNVGQDPRISAFGGRKVATFSLATTEVYKDRDGNKQENTDWHNVVAWSPLAEIVEQFVKKGARIYIEGPTRTRKYTTQSGEERMTVEVMAQQLILLDRKIQGDGSNGRYEPTAPRQPQPQPQPQYQEHRPAPAARPVQTQAAAPAPAAQQRSDYGDALGIPGTEAAGDLPF